jgi:F420-dependent oxidoreductase-like protein
MRFSLRIRYTDPARLAELVRAAQDCGLDGIWVSEPWGFDAGVLLGWCAANTKRLLIGTHVASVFARTPSATAGLAAALQSVSDGRFRLGLGTSGPAVVEGWHGVPFSRPVERTRDTIRVVRAALSGQPVRYAGETARLPLRGAPLRFAQASQDMPVPVYLGALGPNNQRLCAEEADGWTPTPYSPDQHDAFAAELTKTTQGNGRKVAIAPVCPVAVGADLPALLDLERRWSAFYLGGMGEFYARAARTMGYQTMVDRVVRAWRVGDKPAARAALDESYVDSVGLFGSVDRIRQRLDRYAVDELVLELRKPDLAGQLEDLRALRKVIG